MNPNDVLAARLARNMSVTEAADLLGLPPMLVRTLEAGADTVICPVKSMTAEEAVKLLLKRPK